MIYSETISLKTKGFSDIIDMTPPVVEVLKRSGIEDGLVTVFCPGSTGSVTTIEYESGVLRDLQKAIEKIVPSDIPYEHGAPRVSPCLHTEVPTFTETLRAGSRYGTQAWSPRVIPTYAPGR